MFGRQEFCPPVAKLHDWDFNPAIMFTAPWRILDDWCHFFWLSVLMGALYLSEADRTFQFHNHGAKRLSIHRNDRHEELWLQQRSIALTPPFNLLRGNCIRSPGIGGHRWLP